MENASRALVIAGGVLLAIIIISVVVFAYRGITNLQKEKDVNLSSEQVSKINEQIEKYTKKSVIYGSEVLSICNAIEDYRRKYPTTEGYQPITVDITIKNGYDNVKKFFNNRYNDAIGLTGKEKGGYEYAINERDDYGDKLYYDSIPNDSKVKTIKELYNFTSSKEVSDGGIDYLERYLKLYDEGNFENIREIRDRLAEYEDRVNCIDSFRKKQFKAVTKYSETTGIIKSVKIDAI